MQAYILLRGAEQRGHLSLAKPHRIPVEANLQGDVFVLRLKYHNRASHNSSPPVDSKNAWLFIQRSSAQTANPPSLIFPHLGGSACEPPIFSSAWPYRLVRLRFERESALSRPAGNSATRPNRRPQAPYYPCARFLASVVAFAGRHQASLARYHVFATIKLDTSLSRVSTLR